MPSVNVYVPEELRKLLDEMKGDLNLAQICQEALRAAIESKIQRCSRCNQTLVPKENQQ